MGELRKRVEDRKDKLIKKLIRSRIYKDKGKHLFELTLTDIEKMYKAIKKHSTKKSS